MNEAINLWWAAILGLVEGATEFIPVSSTGHLILTSNLLGWNDARAEAFVVFVQLPAILAVVWLYRHKIWDVLRTLGSRESSRRLALNVILGTIPAVVIGFPTRDFVKANLETNLSVALALVIGGLAILFIERRDHSMHVRSVDDIPIKLAIGVGLFQVLALLFPGVSRSAATIIGGLLLGLSRLAATELSFFLAIPAMFGATAVELWKIRGELSASDAAAFAVGAVVSFVSALVVIRALLAFVSRRNFVPFAWYRIALGGAFIVLILWGWLPIRSP